MYGITEGEPFQVFVRRQSSGPNLVIRFECKEGMGILGIRKQGRTDPPPSAAYEEEEIEPASLRAGRFVHVLGNGQRQSYALSRISGDIASQLPADAWVELRPQTEYGFRYLVTPEEGTGAVAGSSTADRTGGADRGAADRGAGDRTGAERGAGDRTGADRGAEGTPRRSAAAQANGQVPVTPPLADAMLQRLPKEQAVEYLRAEMARVSELQQRVDELQHALAKSRSRERDLLAVLGKWQDEA